MELVVNVLPELIIAIIIDWYDSGRVESSNINNHSNTILTELMGDNQ